MKFDNTGKNYYPIMKKILLTVVIASGALFTAKAQDVTFGVKGGLNIAKLTNSNDTKVRPSIYIGGLVNIAFNESFSIQPELLYSGQGNKYDIGNTNTTVTDKVNYITTPVMAQYHIVPEFYLEAGPQLGFLVASKVKSGNVTLDVKDETKSVDFGLGFGLGYQFPIGLGIGARYMFGLTDVYEHNGAVVNTDRNIKNSVAQIGVFYMFNQAFHKSTKKKHR
jgi:hypothetical protein